jgi:arginyl-tRNA synthetase
MSHELITAALSAAFSKFAISENPVLTAANRAGGGDLQCNSVIKFAGRMKQNGKALAQQVVDAVMLPQDVATFTVSGPGFINIGLGKAYLIDKVTKIASSDHFGIAQDGIGKTAVIDFGGPNLAKSLHVGHLRSFVIGESLRRILKATGHSVISDIHLGDHGLQMGKLLLGLEVVEGQISLKNSASWTIQILEGFYLTGASVSKPGEGLTPADAEIHLSYLTRARLLTQQLQDGDADLYAVWSLMRSISLDAVESVIKLLDCHFDLMLGESDSHQDVVAMLAKLTDQGIAVLDQGAVIIPLGDEQVPLLLKSSEQTVLYGATDLAALASRVETMHADEIVYCVDDRQAQHLESVFAAAKTSGLAGNAKFHHAKFGTVKGKDGKALKTREGVPLKLDDLIALVTDAARSQMMDGAKEKDVLAVAVSALKFADLSTDRTAGYLFDEGKMTATEGKSGPYLLYATVRIKSLLEKAGRWEQGITAYTHDDEHALMLQIANWPEAVSKALDELKPHHVAEFAYDLAQAFSRFYNNVPVLSEHDGGLRNSRLSICDLTLKVLTQALYLLGIAVPDRM